MSEKIKDKIEKLLNLSMSDNEHEAALALERALKLMNEHNITKDEVYRQNFINKEIDFEIYRLPDWMVDLYSAMANAAGCVFTWRNGDKSFKMKVKGTLTGRERDVENAIYLIAFLTKQIESKSKEYMKNLKENGIKGSTLQSFMKSFKKGIIQIVFIKLYKKQNDFFNEKEKEPGLVCINLESKINESTDFLNGKFKTHKSKAKIDECGMGAGILAGNDIELNQAVSSQDEIKSIGA